MSSNTRPRPLLRVSSNTNLPRGGLALALSQSSSAPASPAWIGAAAGGGGFVDPYLPDTAGLTEGRHLESHPEAVGRPVYLILKADGTVEGIRKISKHGIQETARFNAAKTEAAVYNTLTVSKEDWGEHIVPYTREISNRDTVILDFKWVAGTSVHTYFAEKAPSSVVKQRIIRGIAHQLSWLATAGYIHGDIKFDNFFIRDDGHILILDFGLAKSIERAGPMNIAKEMRDFLYAVRPYLPRAVLDKMEKAAKEYGGDNKERLIAFYKLVDLANGRSRNSTARNRNTRRH